MQAIEARVRTVYYAPTRRRHYLSKQAAIHAEAVALIQQRHPTENPERDERGRLISEGWHWTDIPRSDVLLRRVKRMVRRRMEEIGDA